MGTTAARRILEEESGFEAPNPMTVEWLQQASRKAMLASHPDSTAFAGDRQRWDDVQSAMRVLGGAI